jgi:hypothetical protein
VVRGTFYRVVNGRWIGSRRDSKVTTHPRWARFGVAALATVVLATGFGLAAELLSGQAAGSPLRLKSVSAAQLDQLGIKLVATSPPPYCALSDAVDDHGWARGGLGGCPISRQVAEKAAGTGVNVTIVESALARATMPQNESVGQDHLVWVVVVRGGYGILPLQPATACPVRVAGASFVCARAFGGSRMLLLDGRTGALLYGSWASGIGVGSTNRSLPTARPPTLPLAS